MKICHVCNFECEDNAELCPLCGADLAGKEEENAEFEERTLVDPVLLATLEDVVSAEIFRDILKENKIPYYCESSESEGAMQVLFGGSFVTENIYVDKSDYNLADRLYSDFLENEPEFDGEFFEENFEEE